MERARSEAIAFCIGMRPFAKAANAEMLLSTTLAITPQPSVNTPATQTAFGTTSIRQLRRTFRSRSVAMSRSSHRRPSPSSSNRISAVSLAMLAAPRSEIETSAFFKARASLIPSPIKQTLLPARWSRSM